MQTDDKTLDYYDYPFYIPKELTSESISLILNCPHLINRLSASLERTFETLSKDESVLEPITIRHVEYSLDECGRNQ